MARHTDGWTDGPMQRPPQSPASTFDPCIVVLSCPRGRFPASQPHVQTPGGGGAGAGREGRGALSLVCFSLSVGSTGTWARADSPWDCRALE
jgi:hypothetical protein